MKRIIYDLIDVISSFFISDENAVTAEVAEDNYPAYLNTLQSDAQKESCTTAPEIDIVLFAESNKGSISVSSCVNQSYGNWELYVIGTSYAYSDKRVHSVGIVKPKDIISDMKGDYVLIIREGDILQSNALERFLIFTEKHNTADAIYADSDLLVKGIRSSPHLKPDFSPETVLSYNYIGRPFFISKKLYDEIGGIRDNTPDAEYAYVLRACESASYVIHLPEVILSESKGSTSYADFASCETLTDFFKRQNKDVYAVRGLYDGSYHVRFITKGRKKVNIILYNVSSKESLREWMEITDDVTESATYTVTIAAEDTDDIMLKRYETALSNSKAARVKHFLQDTSLPIMLNSCAKYATEDALIFCDCSVCPISSDWIQNLLELAMQERIGTVSPLICAPDKRILGAGNIAGTGGWWDVPYYNELRIYTDSRMNIFINSIRNVSICDMNCFMLTSELFNKVGGFDESFMGKAAFAELCIHLFDAHYRSVYTPYSYLQGIPNHFNSPDEEDEVRAYDVMRKMLMYGDPYYNKAYDPRCTVPTILAKPYKPIEFNPLFAK